jgi:predicted aconitase with swiveling domain
MTEDVVRHLQGATGIGEMVEGYAIVSRQGFNARYDLDPVTAIFSRPEHDLFGCSPTGKIYVFATPKGGIATSWALMDLRSRGLAPLGLLCRRANPVVVQGAALADLPLIDRLEPDPTEHIQTGDWIRIHPTLGLVEIFQP